MPINVFVEMDKLKNRNSGLGQFCLHLGKELVKQNNGRFHFTFLLPENEIGIFGNEVNYLPLKWYHKWWIPRKQKFDVWHSIQQSSSFFKNSFAEKKIITIHDINVAYKYTGLKKHFHLKKIKENIEIADKVCCISEFTKSELRKFNLIQKVEPFLIYNGCNIKEEYSNENRNAKINNPFLFNIGIVQPKKNIEVLIDMMAFLPEYDLIIAGQNNTPYANLLRKKIQERGLEKQILWKGEVSEDEKNELFNNCEAFVFPSLAEGFGMPVIEAMYFGKTVFLSKAGSLPEIGGDQAFYFDNFDAKYMSEVVKKGLALNKVNTDLVVQRKERAKEFSWENAAKQYLHIYEKSRR